MTSSALCVSFVFWTKEFPLCFYFQHRLYLEMNSDFFKRFEKQSSIKRIYKQLNFINQAWVPKFTIQNELFLFFRFEIKKIFFFYAQIFAKCWSTIQDVWILTTNQRRWCWKNTKRIYLERKEKEKKEELKRKRKKIRKLKKSDWNKLLMNIMKK